MERSVDESTTSVYKSMSCCDDADKFCRLRFSFAIGNDLMTFIDVFDLDFMTEMQS
jgi:hypothetical protein